MRALKEILVRDRPHRLALSALMEQWGCTAWSTSCVLGLTGWLAGWLRDRGVIV